MKYEDRRGLVPAEVVTPFTGVWIEMISPIRSERVRCTVTPFTGVWIEMRRLSEVIPTPPQVTPFTGVWIEILLSDHAGARAVCHTLHGCVD